MIKSAGHLIGPFEVESALMEHPAVAEAGVIGKPDPVIGEVVKAFVSLKKGYEPSEALRKELLGFARIKSGAGGGSQRNRFPRQRAQDAQRKNHAAPAESSRAGLAGRRSFHLGERLMAANEIIDLKL